MIPAPSHRGVESLKVKPIFQDLTLSVSKGKTRITIFIDTDVLEWFRGQAEREGRGYQTAINQALKNYIEQDRRPIQDIVREVVRKELRVLRKAI
jgi:predicted DNA binding CopG/RHH family protein